MVRQIDPRGVHQIAHLQQRRRQPQQEAQQLLVLRLPLQQKILLEAHLARQKIQQRHAHPQRRGGDRRNPSRRASREHPPAGFDREEIQTIDIQIHPVQELVQIAGVDAVREAPEVQFRVDVQRQLRQHVHLRPPDVTQAGPRLPVEIGQFESVEIGDGTFTDTQPGQGQQMAAAHAPQPGDGDAPRPQQGLFGLGHPAEIARKRDVVIKRLGHDVPLLGAIVFRVMEVLSFKF